MQHLRAFVRKSSNIDFFLKLSPVREKKIGGHWIRFRDVMPDWSPKIREIWLRYCIRIEYLFVQKFYKKIPELKFHPPIIVHVDLKRKFGELETFSELILSLSRHISSLLTAARMPKFDAMWTKNWKFFTFPHWFLVLFFTVCQEEVEKVVYRKKIGGVTDHLRE